MSFPTKYSDLSTKSQNIIGFVTTIAILSPVTYMISTHAYMLLIISINLITIGTIVQKTGSPYYLSWSSGNSMMPSIPLGLTLSFATRNYDEINIGDVVSYDIGEGANIHHRIIGIDENGKYIVKGDGNDAIDPVRITENEIGHKTYQYGYQPIYIPVSPFAIIATFIKAYKKIKGRHKSILTDSIEFAN